MLARFLRRIGCLGESPTHCWPGHAEREITTQFEFEDPETAFWRACRSMSEFVLRIVSGSYKSAKARLRWFAPAVALLTIGFLSTMVSVSIADESATSFWLPGQFGSLAAAPGQPGWALATVYYHTSVSAGADVARSREIEIGRFNPNLNIALSARLNASADLGLIIPSYVFATPVLGGQLAVQMATIVGTTSASVNGTLTTSLPTFGLVRTDSISDSVTGFCDLYPQASLKWNFGSTTS
jgi:hypothetical protein